MVFRIVLAFGVAVATHYAGSLVQALLHCYLGHRQLGRGLHRDHLLNHHAIYSRGVMTSERYLDEERSITAYYVPPLIGLATVAYVFLPFELFCVHVLSLTASFALHSYLHTRYHLERTWLQRFQWFQRKQRLHAVHHRNGSKNFAVMEFVWDRVLGTYQAATDASDRTAEVGAPWA
jgi:hypothetical protein